MSTLKVRLSHENRLVPVVFEVLMHASRWKVPVIFALNKIDLPDCHLDLTRAELRRQCQLLHEHGLVDVDWTREAEEAVPISALLKRNLEQLVERVQQEAGKLRLPLRRLEPLSATPGEVGLLSRHPMTLGPKKVMDGMRTAVESLKSLESTHWEPFKAMRSSRDVLKR